LTRALDPGTQQAVAARLRFYRELGLTEFYRRPVDPVQLSGSDEAPSTTSAFDPIAAEESAGVWAEPARSVPSQTNPSEEETDSIPPRKSVAPPPAIAAVVPAADRAHALQMIREEIGDCTRCALHARRNKLVFGDGRTVPAVLFTRAATSWFLATAVLGPG
jgi:uracil-DNA glycosylase